MSVYMDIKGTSEAYFKIGLSQGARLTPANLGADLDISNTADSAYINIRCLNAYLAGNNIVLNEQATEAGADWKMTIARPSSGMTANVVYTMPAAPTNGYFLTTDGSGNLSWAAVSSPSVPEKVTVDSTPFVFGDFGADLTMFTLPANAVVHDVQVIVDTAFDAAATIEVGITGNTSKYMTTGQNDLTEAARFQSSPNNIPVGTTEAIKGTFTGTPTVGAGRVLVFYSIPA